MLRDPDFEFIRGRNGEIAEVLSPRLHAQVTVNDTAAAIDFSAFTSPIAYLCCPIAIYYETDGTDAVVGASHYLPADVVLPLKLISGATLSVVAAVAGETDSANLTELA